jgi:hypothetical protein
MSKMMNVGQFPNRKVIEEGRGYDTNFLDYRFYHSRYFKVSVWVSKELQF